MNKEIQFLMYSTSQGDVNVEAVVRDETLWLYKKNTATPYWNHGVNLKDSKGYGSVVWGAGSCN